MMLFLLILVLGAAAQFFLPWWIITPICLVLAAWRGPSGGRAFLVGFLGIGLGWLLLAGWLHVQNNGLLSHRVAQLLPLGGQGWLLVLLSATLGGLVGGLATLAGAWLHRALAPAAQPTANQASRV